ncbi:MAG: hypothetical protein ABSF11_06355 [Methylocella sp.]
MKHPNLFHVKEVVDRFQAAAGQAQAAILRVPGTLRFGRLIAPLF